jgi:hypothetical protein
MINAITGAHWLMKSNDTEAERVFLRDIATYLRQKRGTL